MTPSKRDGEASPFTALSRAEQQARWLEWQSRRLSFTPAQEPEDRPYPEERAPRKSAAQDAPAAATPLAQPAKPAPPPRHQELDKIKARHQAAQRTVRAWQTADRQTP